MKWFILVIISLVCSGCGMNNAEERRTNEADQGLLQTGQDNLKSTDEILLESRREVDFDRPNNHLNPTEAEQLVKNKLGINDHHETVVQYDHMEKNHFVIHVYTIGDADGKSEGWYSVDSETKEVTEFEN